MCKRGGVSGKNLVFLTAWRHLGGRLECILLNNHLTGCTVETAYYVAHISSNKGGEPCVHAGGRNLERGKAGVEPRHLRPAPGVQAAGRKRRSCVCGLCNPASPRAGQSHAGG